MNAELLHQAAAKMRQRAEAATPGPWFREYGDVITSREDPRDVADGYDEPRNMRVARRAPHLSHADPQGIANAEHIASWHPAVALLAGKILAHEADVEEQYGAPASTLAVDLACAYLGEQVEPHEIAAAEARQAATERDRIAAASAALQEGYLYPQAFLARSDSDTLIARWCDKAAEVALRAAGTIR